MYVLVTKHSLKYICRVVIFISTAYLPFHGTRFPARHRSTLWILRRRNDVDEDYNLDSTRAFLRKMLAVLHEQIVRNYQVLGCTKYVRAFIFVYSINILQADSVLSFLNTVSGTLSAR